MYHAPMNNLRHFWRGLYGDLKVGRESVGCVLRALYILPPSPYALIVRGLMLHCQFHRFHIRLTLSGSAAIS